MSEPEWYKATVNESETINVAQMFCSVRGHRLRPAFGSGSLAGAHIERS
jgi:hypothetical protein